MAMPAFLTAKLRSLFLGVPPSPARAALPVAGYPRAAALPTYALGPDTLARVARAFDSDWYLAVNDDVRAAGDDPLAHYLTHGHLEGRNPTPYFETRWYRDTYLANGESTGNAECPLVHYIERGWRAGNRPHPLIAPAHVAQHHGVAPDDLLAALNAGEPFIDELCAWFSCSAYLESHVDVAAAGGIAPHHFLHHGLPEGRRPNASYRVVEVSASQARCRRHPVTPVEHLRWRARDYVVERTTVPDVIVRQIFEQGAFDTRIFAPGHRGMANLVQTHATDLKARVGFDHRRMLAAIATRPDVIIVHPRLCVGGSEAYIAGMVRAMTHSLGLRALVVTTDATADEDRAALAFDGLSALRSTQILSIGPELSTAHDPATTLALFLLVAAPKHLFLVNSRTGFEALRRHGRALASVSSIYVPFFSEGPYAMGAPYATRYLFEVIEHVRVFADNQRVLDTLSGRLAHQHQDRFTLLPQTVEIPPTVEFEAALAKRLARRGRWPPRVCWLSRWNVFKATDILVELARRWPDLNIDVYGVPDDGNAFPQLPGLHWHGVARPAALPREIYDAYVFTSQFEGMPNAVLEMAALGVPCVCSDVGGLREVFDETCMDFVTNEEAATTTAESFEATLRHMLGRSDAEVTERVRKAYRAVAARCGEEVFMRGLARMIEVAVPGDEHPEVAP